MGWQQRQNMDKQNAFTLLCAGENKTLSADNFPATLWFSPAVGQMILTMNVTPLTEGANTKAGDVKLELQFIGGGTLELEGDQAHKFMVLLGMRQQLVQPASELSLSARN